MPHARTSLPDSITGDQRVDLITDNLGRLIVVPQMREEITAGTADGVAVGAGGETTIIGAPGAGVRLCLSSFHVRVSVITTIKLLDGSGGTVLWAISLLAGEFLPVSFPAALCFGDNKALVLLSTAAATVFATADAQKAK